MGFNKLLSFATLISLFCFKHDFSSSKFFKLFSGISKWFKNCLHLLTTASNVYNFFVWQTNSTVQIVLGKKWMIFIVERVFIFGIFVGQPEGGPFKKLWITHNLSLRTVIFSKRRKINTPYGETRVNFAFKPTNSTICEKI